MDRPYFILLFPECVTRAPSEDTPEKAKEWAEGEAEREAAMKKISAFAKNPGAALEGMD